MTILVLVKIFNFILEILLEDYIKENDEYKDDDENDMYTYNQQVYDGKVSYHVIPIVDGFPNSVQ